MYLTVPAVVIRILGFCPLAATLIKLLWTWQGFLWKSIKHMYRNKTMYVMATYKLWLFSKKQPLGRFFLVVAMSVYTYIYICLDYISVPFSCNFLWGLSLALRSHDQIPASNWPLGHMIRSLPPFFLEKNHATSIFYIGPLTLKDRVVQ